MVEKKRRHEAEAEASGVEPRTELLNGGGSGGGPRDDEPKKRSGKRKRREDGGAPRDDEPKRRNTKKKGMAKKKRRHEAEAETSGVEPRSELLGGGPRDDEPKKRRREGGGGEGGGKSGSIIDNPQSYELATRVEYQAIASPSKIEEMEKPVEPYYDVFLNFRGADTRRHFVDHLYTSLTDAGIKTFKDDEALKAGEELGQVILQAIKQSKFFIPIFSPDYAFSKWCLKELVQIAKCKENRGQMIMPIFYDVAPSDVRLQFGSYERAFSHLEYQGSTVEAIQNWRETLRNVASLRGWELNGRISDAEAIKETVRRISELKMYDVFLSFRGKDVREPFITSLNEALVQKGIKTFMDSENLMIGEEFPSKLKEAIDQSRTYIVVFSENYAGSWWCLKELVQILGEKNRKKKRLLPIFYKVKPGAVRARNPRKVTEKKWSYEEALNKHKREFGKRKVKKWKEVLSKAANVNGIELPHGYDRNMDGCIRRIVEKTEKMIQRVRRQLG